MKNLVFTFCICFMFNVTKSQSLAKRNVVIREFVTALFQENRSHKSIIDNYMYLAPNDSISLSKREKIIGNLMDSLVTKNFDLKSSRYEIVSYKRFNGEKKKFSGSWKDILILTVDKVAVIYFNFERDKISSFTVIGKGSYSYFIII